MARQPRRTPQAKEPQATGKSVVGLYLYFSVFLSGGSILVMEIAAGRVLAPHFGNTLYTWTSMIGIILAALSLGYSIGGRLADRNPSSRLFFSLMLAGAGLVALVPALRGILLPTMEESLSLQSGPVIAGLLLFAAPGCVLATLTPFAVKLAARGEGSLGAVTGNLFTWSTIGSILGTFATGFVFIPFFGLNGIFLTTAAALTLTATLGLYLCGDLARLFSKRNARANLLLAAFVLASMGTGAAWLGVIPGVDKDTVWVRENMYHMIRVFEREEAGGARVREMFLDHQPEGAMVVGDDRKFFYEYTRFLELGPLFVPHMKRAIFIGGGAFTMPKALHLMKPEMSIAVAELDPEVVDAGRRFFRLEKFPKLKNLVGDGRRILRSSGEKYDLIVGDAYRGLRNIPPHLVTKEFFEEARERLAPGGAFMLNLIGYRAGAGGAIYASVYRTMKSVFPEILIYSTDPANPYVAQNILFFAFGDEDAERFRRVSEAMRREPRFGFAARARVAPPGARLYGPVLTDDYNPVEYLIERGL